MRKIIRFAISLYAVILIANTLKAQNPIPDSLFGINSKLVVQTEGGETRRGSLMLQPDGKIIYGSYDNGNANDYFIDLMRFDECGQLDSLFGTNGLVRHKFDQRNLGYAFALQPDGKILCAGVQAPSNAGSQQHAFVSRFKSDGSPDTSFNKTGTHFLGGTGAFNSVHIINDGRIVCFGQLSTATGAAVVIFLPDGSLDTTFNGDGIASFRPAGFSFFSSSKGHLLSDGKFLLTSNASDVNNAYHVLAVRFDTLGMVDTSYANDGYYYDNNLPVNGFNHPFNSALDANGNLLMAQSTDNTSVDVLRLTPEGIPDSTFGAVGHVHYNFNGTAGGIDILPGGKILVRAKFSINFGIGCGIRLLADGTPDETFGPNGLRQFDLNNSSGTHWLDALLVLPNGQWIAAGAASGFLFKKYGEVSNFPHITQIGGVLSTSGTGNYQWYLNGTEIPGETSQTLPVAENGNFTVMLTDENGCSAMSSIFSVINTGLRRNTLYGDITTYPNPSSGLIYFKGNIITSLPAKIEVRNSLGKLIFSETNFNMNQAIDLSKATRGIYFIHLSVASKVQSFKVIKQ